MSREHAVEVLDLLLEKDCVHKFELGEAGDVELSLEGPASKRRGRIVRILDGASKEVLRLRRHEMSGFRGLSRAIVRATDSSGRTLIRALRPGTYTVIVDGSKATAKVEVRAQARTRVSLRLDGP